MEKVQWNSIDKKQNGLKYSKNDKSSTHPRGIIKYSNAFKIKDLLFCLCWFMWWILQCSHCLRAQKIFEIYLGATNVWIHLLPKWSCVRTSAFHEINETCLCHPPFSRFYFSGISHIDDSLLISDTAEHCSKNVNETIYLLSELGFTINYEKSVLIPEHSIKFLGFIIDSNTMTIRRTSEKLSKLKDKSQSLLNNKIPTVDNRHHLLDSLCQISLQ